MDEVHSIKSCLIRACVVSLQHKLYTLNPKSQTVKWSFGHDPRIECRKSSAKFGAMSLHALAVCVGM